MSIFQAKPWWSQRISAKEEFDERHLYVENIDNSNDNLQKIIIGSFSGFLRVYQPQRGDYSIEHLVFESDLGEPIMQIQCGNFKRTGEVCLCVLHFKKVCFYYFVSTQGFGLQIKLIKEHRLERNAFNMCMGSFGQVKSDYICIQSCDGMLMIYEPEKLQCLCQLSTEYFALPGALTYNLQTDSFIIQNSCDQLECYKYSNIVATSQSQMKDPKRPTPNWSLNIGEQAQKIISVQRSTSICDLVIITEQTLFIVTQSGTIRSQKRFDYPPATIIINEYPDFEQLPNDSTGNHLAPLTFTVASFTHHLMVYTDQFQLIWAAKTDHICHGLAMGSFQKQKGLLTILNEDGWLQVIYMGTSVPTVHKEYQTTQRMPYVEIEQQYMHTLEKIAAKEIVPLDNLLNAVKLNIQSYLFELELNSSYIEDSHLLFNAPNKLVQQVRVCITLTCSIDASDINITIQQKQGLKIQPSLFNQEIYKTNDSPLKFTATIFALSSIQAQGLELEIIASVHTKGNNSRSTHTQCSRVALQLPFSLVAYIIPPKKQAEFKVTLTVSQPIDLHTMFKDLFDLTQKCTDEAIFKECIGNPNAITVNLNDGNQVTILVSKNLDKWRIQSDSFHSLMILIQEIELRGEKLEFNHSIISFVDQIPLQDIFNSFEEHYSLRQSLLEFEKELESKTIEFRVIQKKLLSRYKEKNNSTTSSLEILLQVSFESLLQLIEKTQNCQKVLEVSNMKVITVSQMLVMLIKLRFNLQKDMYQQIQLLFPKDCVSGLIGWEDIAFYNINYFLRTLLKQAEPIQTQQISPIEDISKLQKIITILVDKISKGNIL